MYFPYLEALVHTQYIITSVSSEFAALYLDLRLSLLILTSSLVCVAIANKRSLTHPLMLKVNSLRPFCPQHLLELFLKNIFFHSIKHNDICTSDDYKKYVRTLIVSFQFSKGQNINLVSVIILECCTFYKGKESLPLCPKSLWLRLHILISLSQSWQPQYSE